MAARKTAVKRILKAEVGRFDAELHTIAFNDGDSVKDVLVKAGYDLSEGESVNDDKGNDVVLTAKAKATTYLITGNYTNGC